MRNNKKMFFAGQITGVEGYMESTSSGLVAGINAAELALETNKSIVFPETTMIGSLAKYISDEEVKDFQPMGANFGILPVLSTKIKDKKLRYKSLADRAIEDLRSVK